jgi:hypothetical protein
MSPPLPVAGAPLHWSGARVYDVFLGVSMSSEHSSLYVFTVQPDPVEAQIPAFVTAATGPLFTTAGKVIGTFDLKNMRDDAAKVWGEIKISPSTAPLTIAVQLGILNPPLKRAKVKVSDVVKQPVPVEQFIRKATELGARLRFVDARNSLCGQQLVVLMLDSLERVSKGETCTGDKMSAEQCRGALDTVLDSNVAQIERTCGQAAIEAALTKENESRPPGERLTGTQITAEANTRLTAQPKVLEQVDTELRKLIAAQEPERLTGEATFSNIPLTRWSFGVLASFALQASTSGPRVKVGNDGKLVADPLERQMTLFVVNFAPKGFDPDAKPMMLSERIRPFAGVVATPDFGLGAGVSVGIWKGVGFNIGGALLFVPSLRGGDQIGDVPSQPNDTFGAARATAWFIGASYNFTGK